MERWDLPDRGWKVEWFNRITLLGQCVYTTQKVNVSRGLTALNSEESFLDTLRHEIAHALVGPGYGHGDVWKEKCLKVGCKPEQFPGPGDVVQPKAKYFYECYGCKNEVWFAKWQKQKLVCRPCSKRAGSDVYYARMDWVDPNLRPVVVPPKRKEREPVTVVYGRGGWKVETIAPPTRGRGYRIPVEPIGGIDTIGPWGPPIPRERPSERIVRTSVMGLMDIDHDIAVDMDRLREDVIKWFEVSIRTNPPTITLGMETEVNND